MINSYRRNFVYLSRTIVLLLIAQDFLLFHKEITIFIQFKETNYLYENYHEHGSLLLENRFFIQKYHSIVIFFYFVLNIKSLVQSTFFLIYYFVL